MLNILYIVIAGTLLLGLFFFIDMIDKLKSHLANKDDSITNLHSLEKAWNRFAYTSLFGLLIGGLILFI